jgi:hypothetical protein
MSIHQLPPKSTRPLPCLFVLALPLEAEGLVNKELAEKGDESHDDGDAVIELDHCILLLVLRSLDSPEDNNCRTPLVNL